MNLENRICLYATYADGIGTMLICTRKGEPMGEKEHEYIFQITKDSDGVYCYIKQGELIRCGECARRKTMCDGKDRCTVFNVFVDSDGYCKWAERKADG